MIVTLIPLFIAANITANVGDWKNGPEVIYDAKINTLSYPLGKTDRTFVDHFTMRLKCRPKTESSLSCVIRDMSTTAVALINGVEDTSRLTVEPYTLDKDRMSGAFELDFNNDGLSKIVVDGQSVNSLMIDMVKMLAEQLNIGADMPSIPLSVFSIAENSTTGQCETDFVITSDRLKNDIEEDKKNSYEIVIIPTMRQVRRREVKGIKKSISANKCPYRYQYIDRDGYEIGDLNERSDLPKDFVEIELKSSKARITIMESNFTSSTEDEIIITDTRHKSPTRRVKKTTVTLYDIVPAEGPLPKINNPTTVNRFSRERLV